MKKLLAVAVLATSTVSFAAADRAIYDVMYLPNAGTTYGFSEWSYEMTSIEQNDDAGGDLDIDGWRLSQTVGHSFTDRLSVQADVNYLNAEIDPKDGEKSDNEGLSDLGVNARFRVMDEAIRLDVVGGVQVELNDGSSAGGRLSNNFFNGGNQANVGVQVGEKNENLQWSVLGRYVYGLDRSVDLGSSNVDIKGQDRVQARADLLNKLAEKSYLRSHFTADFVDELKVDETGGGTIRGPQTTYELGTEYQHLMSQDLLARVGVDYRMNNYNSSKVDSDNTWVLRVGANYQF